MLYLYFNSKTVKNSLITNLGKAFRKRNSMWLYDEFNANIIRSIDYAEVLPPNYINHPVFGQVEPDMISNYSKVLILMHMQPEFVYHLSDIPEDRPDLLDNMTKDKHIHLLYDCAFPFPKNTVAMLPEYNIMLRGGDNLHYAYNTYVRNPQRLRSLLCS